MEESGYAGSELTAKTDQEEPTVALTTAIAAGQLDTRFRSIRRCAVRKPTEEWKALSGDGKGQQSVLVGVS